MAELPPIRARIELDAPELVRVRALELALAAEETRRSLPSASARQLAADAAVFEAFILTGKADQ